MKRIELPFEVKPAWLRRLLVIFLLSWMATYSIYTSFYRAEGVETYNRYIDHRAGRSMFYNPWQYRLLCPVTIDVIYKVLDHFVFPLLNINGFNLPVQESAVGKNPNTIKLMEQLKNPEFVKHTIVFFAFRFLQDLAILLLAYSYLSIFVSSNSLRWIGLIIITLGMGNSVVDSDLSFNTYLDVILYLCAGLVIVKNLSPWWIVLITVLGAFNRETSVFIPAIYFMSRADWKAWPHFVKTFLADKSAFLVTTISAILYVIIFFGIRAYYGTRPLEAWRVDPGWPMIKLNFFSSASIKTYMEFFGVFAFFPIWAVFILKSADGRLKTFFYTLVPVWFALHLYTAIGFQTRLFLVPTILVIIPVVLEYIDRRRNMTQ